MLERNTALFRVVPAEAREILKADDLICYVTLRFDPRQMRDGYYPASVSVTMPLLGDRLRCDCTVLVEDTDGEGCRVSLRGTLHIDLPLIGRQAEHEIIQAAVHHHRLLPQIFERYQQVRAELMTTAVGRSALLSGVPEQGLDMSALEEILQAGKQKPYEDVMSPEEPSGAEREPGITAAIAEAQTDATAAKDMAIAAQWNEDMRDWRRLWRELGIALVPVRCPLQQLVALFLSGQARAHPEQEAQVGGSFRDKADKDPARRGLGEQGGRAGVGALVQRLLAMLGCYRPHCQPVVAFSG
ncbi:hypothetical protein WJX81_000738 [Elliptochloris bilobata]|uniref:Uncharacterized protein n=1 Tax=Elliptochloris bilobata TaxID=381761 RepID=A0AAW1QD88_9CHLO